MSKWARINNGKVAEITDIDPAGRFHPSIQWVEFDGRKGVKAGWLYDGSEFSEPAAEQPPEPDYFTMKHDIWQRATEDEAEILDQALAQAPAKERRLFDDSTRIEHNDEYFPMLQARITELLGETRALELLAPSN